MLELIKRENSDFFQGGDCPKDSILKVETSLRMENVSKVGIALRMETVFKIGAILSMKTVFNVGAALKDGECLQDRGCPKDG